MNSFKNHLHKHFEKEIVDNLCDSFYAKPLNGVIINTNKISSKKFLEFFPDVVKHEIIPNAFLYEKEKYQLGKHVFFDIGLYYLQEPSAMLVSYLFNIKQDDIVLDLCAAPGGKTFQASLKASKGIVYANDISYKRALVLKDNIERNGLENVIVTCNDYSTIYTNYLNYFDKIILDAPCSGSGMFRKNEEILNEWSENKVAKCSQIQNDLFDIAVKMLKPGGQIMYSTCSYSYEENEEIVINAIRKHDLVPVKLNDHKSFYHHKNLKEGIHLLPNLYAGEGHFICCLMKKNDLNMPTYKVNNSKINNEFYHNDIVKTFGHENRNLIQISSIIYSLPYKCKIDKLNVLSAGVAVCKEKSKGIFVPSHHLALSYNDNINIISINKEQLIKYINGETLDYKIENGYYILKYLSFNVGFVKCTSNVLKNHYPKYLRKKLIINTVI